MKRNSVNRAPVNGESEWWPLSFWPMTTPAMTKEESLGGAESRDDEENPGRNYIPPPPPMFWPEGIFKREGGGCIF